MQCSASPYWQFQICTCNQIFYSSISTSMLSVKTSILICGSSNCVHPWPQERSRPGVKYSFETIILLNCRARKGCRTIITYWATLPLAGWTGWGNYWDQLYITAITCTVVNCTVLKWTSVLYTALHGYEITMTWIALHCTELECDALICPTLHCTGLKPICWCIAIMT